VIVRDEEILRHQISHDAEIGVGLLDAHLLDGSGAKLLEVIGEGLEEVLGKPVFGARLSAGGIAALPWLEPLGPSWFGFGFAHAVSIVMFWRHNNARDVRRSLRPAGL
jgi:hypothetical protein